MFHKWKSLGLLAVFAGIFLLRRYVGSSLVDISEFKEMCERSEVKKIVIGSMLIYGVPKNPTMRSYFLSNRSLMSDESIMHLA